MVFDTERVRTGEWILLLAGVALIVDLTVLPWYGLSGVFGPTASSLGSATAVTGWSGLLVLGPIILVVALGGVAVWWLQATCAAPALPVVSTAVELLAALLLVLALIVRVVFAVPQILIDGAPGTHAIDARYGAYAGLGLALLLALGAFLSLRQDGVATFDAPERIEFLRLSPRR
jgi:hypothetical protein